MHRYCYFVLGVILIVGVIKLLLPKPKIVNIYPNLKNYDGITYIDAVGKRYKYVPTYLRDN